MSEEVKVVAAESTETVVADPVSARLAELGVSDKNIVDKIKALGAENVDDLSALKEADLVDAGVPVLKARKVLSGLSSATVNKVIAENTVTATANFDAILPSVPDDGSWLNALRTGGVLKIEQSTVISAIRAALADRFGLYNISKKLHDAIEEYVDVTEEQVGEEFWSIRKQLTRVSYGDLFSAIPGMDGSYVTAARKSQLLGRINENVWPSIVMFNQQLVSWQEAWMQGGMNPGMMMAALASFGGGGGTMMPPGMMQPPDCGVLRDAAATVNDSLNKTFRGTGVQIAAALAYEANQVKKIIENPRIPILCGVPSRDLLLKKLGVAVPATYPRMEQNLTRFVLGIMQVDRVAGGNEELQYFGSLYMLGSQIPWADLNEPHSKNVPVGRRPRGIATNNPFNDDNDN